MLEGTTVTARELMTRGVTTVGPETSLLEAVKLMARRRISGVPVLDAAGALVGILTDGDLMRWREGYAEKQARWLETLAEGADLAPTFTESIRNEGNKVKAVMSSSVVTITENTPAPEIASLMIMKGIKRVPVLRGERLVGIVAQSDLVRAFAELLPQISTASASDVGPQSVDEALRRGREEALAAKPR